MSVMHRCPFSKGGRRCFQRHPQVGRHEDYSLLGGATRRPASNDCGGYYNVTSKDGKHFLARRVVAITSGAVQDLMPKDMAQAGRNVLYCHATMLLSWGFSN
jgi:hypothetical protein